MNPWSMKVPHSDPPDFDAIRGRVNYQKIVEQEWGIQLKHGRCACKFHDGDNPTSFSVNGDVATCFSQGCFSGDVFSFVAKARGITVTEAARAIDPLGGSNGKAPSGPKAKPRSKAKEKAYPTPEDALHAIEGWPWATKHHKGTLGKPAIVYPYPHPDGRVEAYMARFERTINGVREKTCRPITLHPDGWKCAGPTGKWPPFNADKLAGEKQVILVEGEKCARIAEELGFVATTSAHGAQSPEKTDWTILSGVEQVPILPDFGKAGEDYLHKTASILATLVPKPIIKIVRLPSLKNDKDDIEQWRDAQPELWEPEQLKSELQRLIQEAPEWVLPEKPKLVVRADQVEEKDIVWLWQDRIPCGFLTIFAGRTGVGKSFVAFDIVARVTRGWEWPDLSGECAEVGNVLIFSEDPQSTILVPRLRTLGADLSRVHFVTWDAMADYELSNTDMLDDIVNQSSSIPSLIIIDPPTNFLGKTDENSNSQVRKVLMKLVKWVDTRPTSIAIIMITQVNKGGSETEAINRIIASIAWAATSRIAHTFAPDKEVPSGGTFACPKTNLGVTPKTLKYHIEKVGKQGRIIWDGQSELTADEAIQAPAKKNAGDKAVEWVTARFREQRQWLSDDLGVRAAKDEISTWELFKGGKVKSLPITKRQVYDHEKGENRWTWFANDGWPQ